MILPGAASQSLIFPLKDQPRLLDREKMIQTNDGKKLLLSGVKHSTVFSRTDCCIQIDPIVSWFDREKVRARAHSLCLIRHNTSEDIVLLLA